MYSVTVTNKIGSATSSNAVLTVVPPGLTETNKGNLPPGVSQYFHVLPVVALLPTNLAVWASAAGTVDFHGQKQIQMRAAQTNYYDEFNKRGKYRVEWTPDDSSLNIEARIVDLDTVPTNNRPHLPFASLLLIPNESKPGEPIRADERASFHGDAARKLTKFEINWDQRQFQALDDVTRMHVFEDKGAYPVALRVTDDIGQFSVDTETAYVGMPAPGPHDNPPIPRLRLLSKDLTTLTAVVADDGSYAPSGKIASWTFNWGDHSPDQQFTIVPTNQSHVFSAPGVYEISLSCVDDKQRPSHSPAILEVNLTTNTNARPSQNPTNSLDSSPTNAYISLSLGAKPDERKVLFDAKVEAFAFPAKLKVDFGDGSSQGDFVLGTSEAGEKRSETKQFSHEYSTDSNYVVNATAVDSKGRSDSRQIALKLEERQFEMVKTANEPTEDHAHVKVTLLVRDKSNNNATDFSVLYWLVNDKKVERVERDYTATTDINTTNAVYARLQSGSGSVIEVGIRVIVPQKIISEIRPGEIEVQPLTQRKP